jgi:hypothetical protein
VLEKEFKRRVSVGMEQEISVSQREKEFSEEGKSAQEV